MMKSCIIILALAAFSLALRGQQTVDWGVSAGTTAYIGDINPDNLFVSPGMGAALFHRYNFHPRHSLRSSIMAGTLRGNDQDAENAFQTNRGDSFSGLIGELSTQVEFNFFPYRTDGQRWSYSPYIAGGIGVSFIGTEVFTYTPVIPFSLGFKLNIQKNLGLEIEYGFRKTFYDNFDGLTDPVDPGHHAWTHNNDWYTFAAVSFTWKMFNRLAGCPAYEEEKNYRRR
ncbi:MAG: DUF6089 family protein [Bacteroidales bacterium]|jgi:hypothetical protein|nr:DUF6089 family protein [Bacteroidales bacterium]